MNYNESQEIKKKIDSSSKILVNMHHNPDADSVGSALSMARVLEFFGKEVKIISPSELAKNLKFLIDGDDVDVIDYESFIFADYDLFICCDSSSLNRVAGGVFKKPDIYIVNIDHHKSNTKYGDINLVVPEASANCEVLYYLFQDWGIKPDIEMDYPDIHTPLLAGIIGDTGAFRFPEADRGTFQIAQDLMTLADKNRIIFNLYQSFEESHVMAWKEIMNNLKIDHESRFVYSFVKKDVLEKYGRPFNAKSELADMLFQSIDGTDFGIIGAEEEGYISVSFRSRTGVDVSVLAQKLGGGGHSWAAAARITYNSKVNYDVAVEKILKEARRFVERGSFKP